MEEVKAPTGRCANCPRAIAHYRFNNNMPVTVRQAAELFEIHYVTMLKYVRETGFPIWNGLIFPEDFRRWRQQQFSQQSARSTGQHQPSTTADTRD